mmetsp:Transcript_7974/g.17984  ORF Transcript_7974/g.17984 Transcript_7974/m.17984 type:complete len:232 (-) Transcript_7974:199-894(-)
MDHNYGYNAVQWCFGDMRNKFAWSKHGGGKLLTDADVNELLDLVVKWQNLTEKVLRDVLLPAIPGLDPNVIPYLHKARGDPLLPTHLAQKAKKAIQDAVTWSNRMLERMRGPEGCTALGVDPFNQRVESGRDGVDILIGHEQVFNIPSNTYKECDNLNRKITGEPILPSVFFQMISGGVWWEARRDPDTGSAIGFGIRMIDLDWIVSEEDGKQQAEQMAQAVKDQIEGVRK